MIKRIISIFAAVIFTVLFWGCQSSPTSDLIVNKESDYYNNLTEASSAKYFAPNTVRFAKTIHNLKMVFNAQVNIPETENFGVVKVKKKIFSKSEIEGIMSYFGPNSNWIERPPETKGAIQYRLYRIMNSDRFEAFEKSEYERTLAQEIENAPDSEIFTAYNLAENLNLTVPNAAWYLRDDGRYSSFIIGVGENSYQYLRDEESAILQEDFLEPDSVEKPDFQITPDISKNDAMKIAQKTLKDLHVDPALEMLYCKKAIAYQYREPMALGWQMAFTRTSTDLQIQYDFNGYYTWINSPKPTHAAPWDQEVVLIFVDSEGVYKFDLRGAGIQDEVLFRNVGIIAFDEMIERLENQLVFQHAYQDESIEEYSVIINSINLECSLIDQKEDPESGILIPSWNIGYQLLYRSAGEAVSTVIDLHLLLNAIDGSYIEPRATEDMLGY